jgi:hypothetical protein
VQKLTCLTSISSDATELFYCWKLKAVVLRESSGAAIQIPNNFFSKDVQSERQQHQVSV